MTSAPEFFSSRFHYTFGAHEPMIRVESGDSLCVICPDSDNRLADETELSIERRQSHSGSDLFEGNPVGGPIFVQGAACGDVLAIDIDEIKLDRASGQTLLAPGHGLLSSDELLRPDEFFSAGDPRSDQAMPRHMYEWSIDPITQSATIKNPLGDHPFTVPLKPMVGTIGVCPPWGQSLSTLLADVHGGNMDLPILGSGTTIFLPVFFAGALLMLGDIHAAQGHGEIVGGGIETSGRVSITIRNRKDISVAAPMIATSDAVYAVKVHGDLRAAVRGAYAYLVDWLATQTGFNRWDAYQLISQVGRIEIGGITTRSTNVVAAGIPCEVLPDFARERIDSLR